MSRPAHDLRSYHSTNVLATPSSNVNYIPGPPGSSGVSSASRPNLSGKRGRSIREIPDAIQHLSGCAHFHYESVELTSIQVRLDASCRQLARHPYGVSADSAEACFWFRVRSNSREWVTQRSYASAVEFDTQLHRCVYDRRLSRLPELAGIHSLALKRLSVDEVLFTLQSYMVRFSEISGSAITCFPVLKWLEVDSRGNRLMPAEETAINTPAIAAAFCVRSYDAGDSDELSLRLGDIVSVIDMPASSESKWWRGKLTIVRNPDPPPSNSSGANDAAGGGRAHTSTSPQGYQVGFFPADRVELFDKTRGAGMLRSLDRSLEAEDVDPGNDSTQDDQQHNYPPPPRLADQRGKVVTFMRGFLPNRPSRKRLKATGILRERVFGCDLAEHVENTGLPVPHVVSACAEFIEKNALISGIYRISGVQSNIQQLRHEFDSYEQPNLLSETILCDRHCVASVMKMYFRELPNPLFTYHLYAEFMSVFDAEKLEHDRLLLLRRLVDQLPPPHYRTAEYLIRHLARLSRHKSITEMDTQNFAIVWAPNLFRSHTQDLSTVFGREHAGTPAYLSGVNSQAVVTELMIRHVDQVFTLNAGGGPEAVQGGATSTPVKRRQPPTCNASISDLSPSVTSDFSTPNEEKLRRCRPASATKLMELTEARSRLMSCQLSKVPPQAGLPDLTNRKCIDVQPVALVAADVTSDDSPTPTANSKPTRNLPKKSPSLSTSTSTWWSSLIGSHSSSGSSVRPEISLPIQRSLTTDMGGHGRQQQAAEEHKQNNNNAQADDDDTTSYTSTTLTKGWDARRQRLSSRRRQSKRSVHKQSSEDGENGTDANDDGEPPQAQHSSSAALSGSPLRAVKSAESLMSSLASKGNSWRKSLMCTINNGDEQSLKHPADPSPQPQHRRTHSNIRPDVYEPAVRPPMYCSMLGGTEAEFDDTDDADASVTPVASPNRRTNKQPSGSSESPAHLQSLDGRFVANVFNRTTPGGGGPRVVTTTATANLVATTTNSYNQSGRQSSASSHSSSLATTFATEFRQAVTNTSSSQDEVDLVESVAHTPVRHSINRSSLRSRTASVDLSSAYRLMSSMGDGRAGGDGMQPPPSPGAVSVTTDNRIQPQHVVTVHNNAQHVNNTIHVKPTAGSGEHLQQDNNNNSKTTRAPNMVAFNATLRRSGQSPVPSSSAQQPLTPVDAVNTVVSFGQANYLLSRANTKAQQQQQQKSAGSSPRLQQRQPYRSVDKSRYENVVQQRGPYDRSLAHIDDTDDTDDDEFMNNDRSPPSPPRRTSVSNRQYELAAANQHRAPPANQQQQQQLQRSASACAATPPQPAPPPQHQQQQRLPLPPNGTSSSQTASVPPRRSTSFRTNRLFASSFVSSSPQQPPPPPLPPTRPVPTADAGHIVNSTGSGSTGNTTGSESTTPTANTYTDVTVYYL